MYKDKTPRRKSKVQCYECQATSYAEPLGKRVSFDACLAKELFYLWDKGIKTTGSCCGRHAGDVEGHAYIGVAEEHINTMKDLGYAVKHNSCRPFAQDSFMPKSQGLI